jgi:hypothetical protein
VATTLLADCIAIRFAVALRFLNAEWFDTIRQPLIDFLSQRLE